MNINRISALAAFILLSVSIVAAATSDRPNILFLLADDQGYGDLGCYGSTNIAADHPARVQELTERMKAFTNELDANSRPIGTLSTETK